MGATLLKLFNVAADGKDRRRDPVYSTILDQQAPKGTTPEAQASVTWQETPGQFADGTPFSLRKPVLTISNLRDGALASSTHISMRIPRPVFGLGFLEAVDEKTILANADPNDSNQDGISGRPGIVADPLAGAAVLGRWGGRRSVATLQDQAALAFNNDIGLTSPIFPKHRCGATQTACQKSVNDATTELSATDLTHIQSYLRGLSVPPRRNFDDPEALRGQTIFMAISCNRCHIPNLVTSSKFPIPEMRNIAIQPFTDLLIHDMGPGLADDSPVEEGRRRLLGAKSAPKGEWDGLVRHVSIRERVHAEPESERGAGLPARRPRAEPDRGHPVAQRRSAGPERAVPQHVRDGSSGAPLVRGLSVRRSRAAPPLRGEQPDAVARRAPSPGRADPQREGSFNERKKFRREKFRPLSFSASLPRPFGDPVCMHPRRKESARAGGSHHVFRRALGWAIDAGKQVSGVLSTEDLIETERVLGGGAPFPAEAYPKLKLFAEIAARIEAPDGVPGCTLGDALEAVAALASSLPPWSFVPAIEPLSFRALDYARNAERIDREYRRNQPGWSAHGELSRRFIVNAVATLERREVVWVLGAGRAYDLPLEELAEDFDKVVLVDLELEAMQATLGSLGEARRESFELLGADLTGIAGVWRARTREAIDGARDARGGAARLHALFQSYAVAEPRPWAFLGARPNLIVSQMVLSQLNEPLERYARRAYADRFAVPLLEQHPKVALANMLFAHRVQHDHLRFLRAHAPAAVLTSDVAEQYTRLGSTGVVELVGDELLLLGAHRLLERVPHGLDVVRRHEWHWDRARFRAGADVGSRMRVGALLLPRGGLKIRTLFRRAIQGNDATIEAMNAEQHERPRVRRSEGLLGHQGRGSQLPR